jgi:hypothetical protein
VTETGARLRYEDLQRGDVIEIQINAPLFSQVHGEWERREVVAVAIDPFRVTFRDGGREYEITASEDQGRRMRRV